MAQTNEGYDCLPRCILEVLDFRVEELGANVTNTQKVAYKRKWIEEGLHIVVYDSTVCESIVLWTCLRGAFRKRSMGQSEQCIFRYKKVKDVIANTSKALWNSLWRKKTLQSSSQR